MRGVAMEMITEIDEFIKEVFESKRKKKEFWGKVIIDSGPSDNKAELKAMVELLNGEEREADYLAQEDFHFIDFFLNCKLYAKKIYDDFVKNIPAEIKHDLFDDFVNRNFDIIVIYAVLNIKNPLRDKIKNLQRFVFLYKCNNAPNDGEGFVIPYCFFEVVEQFASVLERCIFAERVLQKIDEEEESGKKNNDNG